METLQGESMIDFKKLKKIPREGAVQIGDLLLECASWNNDRKDKRQNVGLVLRKRGLSEFLIKYLLLLKGQQ